MKDSKGSKMLVYGKHAKPAVAVLFGGHYRDIKEYDETLSSSHISDEVYEMTMSFVRAIVVNEKLARNVREHAAKVMYKHSLDVKAAASLFEPVPLHKRKRLTG